MRASVALFVILALAACSGGVAIDATGPVSEYGLAVGDCFDDPPEFDYDPEATIPVACSEPHDNEVYVVGTAGDGEYPGEIELNELADDFCLAEFESFIGVPWDDSVYDFIWIVPDGTEWDAGRRDVICAAYDLDLAKLTGTLRDIGE